VTVDKVYSFNGKSANEIYKVVTQDNCFIVKIFSYPYIEPGMAKGAGYTQRVLAGETDFVPDNYFIGEYGDIPYVIHISEYIDSHTYSQDWRYVFDSDKQKEMVSSLGKLLSELQASYSFNSDGEVVGYSEDSGFEIRADSWEQTIRQIFNRRRDHSYKVDVVDNSCIDELISTVEPIVDSWSIEYTDSVLCHNDIRIPNVTVEKEKVPMCLVDWDNVAIGDWVFGFSRAEYTVSNKPSRKKISRDEAKESFREGFFENSENDSLPDRYYIYRALSILQEVRSFEYWYQNKSQDFKSEQKQWLESEIYRLEKTIQNKDL